MARAFPLTLESRRLDTHRVWLVLAIGALALAALWLWQLSRPTVPVLVHGSAVVERDAGEARTTFERRSGRQIERTVALRRLIAWFEPLDVDRVRPGQTAWIRTGEPTPLRAVVTAPDRYGRLGLVAEIPAERRDPLLTGAAVEVDVEVDRVSPLSRVVSGAPR